MAGLIAVTNVATTSLPTAQPIIDNLTVVNEQALENLPGLTIEQLIRSYSKEYGINEELAVGMAFCESTLRQFNENGEVLRGIVNSQDVGVFQINEKYHLDTSSDLGLNIYTAPGNIEYAMWLMQKEGVRHWKASRPCWGENAHLALK